MGIRVNCIVSSIPGRLRLRHPALRNPARLEKLEHRLAAWPQVLELKANPATGSLLLRYDVVGLGEAECASRCEAALADLLPRPPEKVAVVDAPPAKPRSTRARTLRANRLAKRGMLASLVASMLLAAAGAKRGHIWTGMFFLHALGVHLWVHRRTLIS